MTEATSSSMSVVTQRARSAATSRLVWPGGVENLAG